MSTILNTRVLSTKLAYVTSTFANHKLYNKYARGIDLVSCNANGSYVEAKVLCHSDGIVLYAGNGDGYGNAVWVRHQNGYVTGYGHMRSLNVKTGQPVTQGTILGVIGTTGNSSGIHLHFEVRKYTKSYTDPTKTSFWASDSFMSEDKFEWIDPATYLNSDLYATSASTVVTENYAASRVPNRFKVQLNGSQVNAYTYYTSACAYADKIGGIVVDGNNGMKIYPVEDYTKNTIPNRFRVKLNGVSIGAYTNYNGALSVARAKNAHIYDAANGMTMIY